MVNMHRIVPDHNISCLAVSSIHPALQMLQLPMNIRGKGLEILIPALPAPSPPPPPPNCVSTLCLPAAMHVVRSSRPSPSVSHFCILHSYDERLVGTCALTSQEWLLLTTKSTSQRIQA